MAAEIKRGNLIAISRGRKRIVSRLHLETWLASKPSADAIASVDHGDTTLTPVSDASRIATALEAIGAQLAGIRSLLSGRIDGTQ